MAQLIKCLLYKLQDLSSIIRTHGKVPGMVALAYKPSIGEAGTDISLVLTAQLDLVKLRAMKKPVS